MKQGLFTIYEPTSKMYQLRDTHAAYVSMYMSIYVSMYLCIYVCMSKWMDGWMHALCMNGMVLAWFVFVLHG